MFLFLLKLSIAFANVIVSLLLNSPNEKISFNDCTPNLIVLFFTLA
jgi:hypothetical protein